MSSNNEVTLNCESIEGVGSARKSWIRFEEQPLSDKYQNDENTNIATIEPSHSIQISNVEADAHKRSTSAHLDKSMTAVANNVIQNSNNNVDRQSNNEVVKVVHSSVTAERGGDHVVIQCNHSAINSRTTHSNGDIIVTLLPLNSHCSWITPAKFKPELVPEELMAQRLSLTVEDYVSAMQVLVNDLRFNLYITLYKRILVLWIALGFAVLLALLFSGVKGLTLFAGGVLWLVINALGIFATMWIKVKIYHLLERCIAQVNGMFYKYNILVGVDDRGRISCHKVNLVFIYFDVTHCIKFLKEFLESDELTPNGGQMRSSLPIVRSRMDINTSDIIITGSAPKTLSQKEKTAEKLVLRYSQRWAKDFVRRRIDLNLPLHADAAGVSVTPQPTNPRHCASSRCLCQFIEEHLRFKPLTQCNIAELFM